MPNGGRLGDNPQSWFMDDLCGGQETYLGEPIDSLACEIYRVSRHEYAAGIDPNDNKDEINPIKLEAKLREKLVLEKERRKERVDKWSNTDTSGEPHQAPFPLIEPIKDTVRHAMSYCINLDACNTRQIDELMYMADSLREYFSKNLSNWSIDSLSTARHMIDGFDKQEWEGAPKFTSYFDNAVEQTKK